MSALETEIAQQIRSQNGKVEIHITGKQKSPYR